MCGRTVCTLGKDAICRRCAYRDRSGNVVEPSWREAPSGDLYHPSYNIPPTAYTPVLVNARVLEDAWPAADFESALPSERQACSGVTARSSDAAAATASARVVQPMRWGMVPAWHSGPDVRSFSLLLSNCRSDSMKTKRSFLVPLRKGRRCVVLAEGFYEWKQTTKPKQPYFIRYRPSCAHAVGENTKADDIEVKKENVPAGPGFLDGELMKMAGIFDVWKDPATGIPLYSYSVITVDGTSTIGDIHDRMPAILQDDDEVACWLNSDAHPLDEVVKLVRPAKCVDCYPVSTFVSNVRNNSPECIAPLIDRKQTSLSTVTASSSGLMKWFRKSDVDKKNTTSTPEIAFADSTGHNESNASSSSTVFRPPAAAATAATAYKRFGQPADSEDAAEVNRKKGR